MSYYGPCIAALDDIDSLDGPDHDVSGRPAEEHQAAGVIDVACGSAILTVTRSGPGCTVIGIEPSPAILAYARNRPGGDQATWVLGTAKKIAPASADMSGNVAMHKLGEQLPETLDSIARSELRQDPDLRELQP